MHISPTKRERRPNSLYSRILLQSLILFAVILTSSSFFSLEARIRAAPLDVRLELRDRLSSSDRIKTILLWNSYFDEKHFNFGVGKAPFKASGCPVSNCAIWDESYRKTDLPHESFDAVVFHVVNLIKGPLEEELPLMRLPSQRYVFFLLEAPATNKFQLLPYNDFFNLTMTYRRDSDIFTPYGWLASKDVSKSTHRGMLPSKKPTKWIAPSFEHIEYPRRWTLSTKKKMVAWFVSNCLTPSNREEYVKELSLYIEVDIYGKCGTVDCKMVSSSPYDLRSNCYHMVEETYMFYLAFENSLCIDYVTEKFFVILKHNVVPVVYGGADYDRFAPPMSYINAKDYSSPRDLANYLTYLSKTPEEYQKYFWWKRFYRVITNTYTEMFCSLCEILNDDSRRQVVRSDVESWWNARGVCE